MIAASASIQGSTPVNTHVAALLPATASQPEPARRVNFLKALLLYWLFPKRFGPHLAAGSWTRAILAHVLSVVFGTGSIVLAQQGMAGLKLSKLTDLRIDLARAVVNMAASSAQGGVRWEEILVTASILPAVEVALPLLAIMLMPWLPGGDRAESVFRRSLKHVYWSTSMAIPVCGLIAIGGVLIRSVGEATMHEFAVQVGLIALTGLVLFLFVRMLIVGAARYVGPPEGPAFSPREPQCDGCGYLIVGLPLDSLCPECGLSVGDSLPGGRRRPTTWQLNQFRPAGFADLLRLQLVVLFRGRFFQTLPVHEGVAAARHFWWMTWCLMAVALLGMVQLVVIGMEWTMDPIAGVLLALGALAAPFVLQTLMLFPGCIWGQFRHGIKDYRVSAIVCYYAAPLMWPTIAYLGGLLGLLLVDPRSGSRPQSAGMFGLGEEVEILLAAVILPIALLSFWWIRLTDALRRVRHSNV